MTYQVHLSIYLNGILLNSVFAQNGQVINVGPFTLNFVGAFTPPLVDLSNFALLQDNSGNQYLSPACSASNPCVGLPGDIQSNTLTDLQSQSLSSIIINQNLVSLNPQDTYMAGTFIRNGVSNMQNKLPSQINGRLWYGSPYVDNIYANETSSKSILFTVSSNTGVSFTRTIEAVCPDMQSFSIEGCHSCPQTAKINLVAKSSCLPGSVFVSTTSKGIYLYTDLVFLTTGFANVSVFFQTNESYVDFELTLSYESRSATKRITGQLADLNDIVAYDNSATVLEYTDSTSTTDFDIFSNFYKSVLFGNWWSALLSTLAHIVLFFIILWLIDLLYKFFSKLHRKVKTKYLNYKTKKVN
jgi:hypothetical protein